MSDKKSVKLVCPMCGGEAFTDGMLAGVVYIPRGGFVSNMIQSMVRGGLTKSVPTRTCIKCGFAALIIPPENRI